MPDRRDEPATSGIDENRYAGLTNVSQLLRVAAERSAHEVALVAPGQRRRTLTWAQFDDESEQFARALSTKGMVAGQRVALALSNGVELAVAYFGTVRGGMIAVPVDPTMSDDQVASTLAASTPRIVVSDSENVGRIRAAIGEDQPPVTVLIVGSDAGGRDVAFADFVSQALGPEPVAPVDAELTAMLAFSAAGGESQLAMLSHRALLANVEQMVALQFAPIGPGDTVLSTGPLAHIYGLNALLAVAARQRAATVLSAPADPSELAELIESEAVTVLAADPPTLLALSELPGARAQLSGMRLVRSAAVSLSDDVTRAFTDATGHIVERGYGLPEGGPAVCATLASNRDSKQLWPKPGSSGGPLPGVQLRVVDQAGSTASPGDPGEIVIQGQNLFSGYWPYGSDGPDEQGWYHTGHVGVRDADGDLTVVERTDDVLTVSGFSVFPSEVEAVIAELDGVRSVAVAGRADPITGQAVVAYVVREAPRAGKSDSDVALTEAIDVACGSKLARFKRPADVVIVEELPPSRSGASSSESNV